jgi:pimeloyl-ACP methyl ester carboxylesterase
MHEQTLPETRWARAGDIDIAYQAVGDGHPLLLIIGHGGVKELWTREFIEPLSERFKVITFDNRGMGETPAGARRFSISQFASDALGLLTALGIESAHLLGYSMGGYIAQEMAIEEPGRVERLVLLATECGGANGMRQEPGILFEFHGADSSGRGGAETERRFFFSREQLERSGTNPGNVLGDLEEKNSSEHLEAQAAAMREWRGTCDRLSLLKQPSLVITGTDDIVILPENAAVLSELIPDSELVEMEGAHHGLIMQYPAELAHTVGDFLSG